MVIKSLAAVGSLRLTAAKTEAPSKEGTTLEINGLSPNKQHIGIWKRKEKPGEVRISHTLHSNTL